MSVTPEQFKVIEALSETLPVPTAATDYRMGWLNGIVVLLDAIRRELVIKVDVSPTATATGTIEGLDGLGRRGQG